MGIDNLPGSLALERHHLPERCVLLFGQEGPGLSATAVEACASLRRISQFGSTRSINAGAAECGRHVGVDMPARGKPRELPRRLSAPLSGRSSSRRSS